MDPSTSTTPNTEQSAQGKAQSPNVPVQPPTMAQLANIPTPQTVSSHPEHAPVQTGAAQETPEDNEDMIQPAKQETGAPVSVQQVAEIQAVEIKPSIPEVAVEKSLEQIVEKSPDIEKPQLSQVVKDAGVTLSGPGIPVEENKFAVQAMPMTYPQAEMIEKTTKIKESKHWLAELILYMWRKLNPMLGKKERKN